MRRWFLPRSPDLVALLGRQAAITVGAMDAFVAWSRGEAGRGDEVRDAEHAADDVRRELQTELRRAFTTPLDPEDLYELSERLDVVLNGAKNVVRECEVMELAPDRPLGDLAEPIADGVRHLAAAFAHLVDDQDLATDEADRAIATQRELERRYRVEMSELVGRSDLAEVTARRELYRRYARLGDSVVRVAERVWYAVVKTA